MVRMRLAQRGRVPSSGFGGAHLVAMVEAQTERPSDIVMLPGCDWMRKKGALTPVRMSGAVWPNSAANEEVTRDADAFRGRILNGVGEDFNGQDRAVNSLC